MGDMSRINSLANFINILREADIMDFNINNFNHRIRLQKYVYLARDFGFELAYPFNMYIHGPYSRELARDYYSIREEDIRQEKIDLDRSFLKLIKGRNRHWLEIAATTRMIERENPGISREDLFEYVKMAKDYATDSQIMRIYRELH